MKYEHELESLGINADNWHYEGDMKVRGEHGFSVCTMDEEVNHNAENAAILVSFAPKMYKLISIIADHYYDDLFDVYDIKNRASKLLCQIAGEIELHELDRKRK